MLFLLSDTNTILTNVIAFYSNYDWRWSVCVSDVFVSVSMLHSS
jgi:hypothetical protein